MKDSHAKFAIFGDPYLAVLLVLAAFLIFFNLGAVYLWEDEAETALVAKSIWTQGIPKITDGINYFYQEQGKRVGFGDVWAWTPWLQFYVASLSLRLFGSNALAARLPFAFVGWLSLLFLFRITDRLFDRLTARIALLLASCSVPLLLYIRQCRYYSLVIFSVLWVVLAVIQTEQAGKKRIWGLISLFLALSCLFHANYIACFGIWLSVLFYAYSPGVLRRARLDFSWTLLATAAFNAPWFFLFKPLHEQTRTFDLEVIWESVIFYLENMNHYVTPAVLLVLIPLLVRFLPNKKMPQAFDSNQKRWIFFLLAMVFLTAVFALMGPAKVFRYLVGVLAICALLLAVLIRQLWDRNRWVTGILLSILVLSNCLHVAAYPVLRKLHPPSARHLKGGFQFPIVSYIQELFDPPHGSTQAIVQFLKANASQGDLVLATYGNLPIMFYTGLRVIGGLSIEALDEAKNAEWVIPRKVVVSDEDGRVMVYLLENLKWERYEQADLAETDFPWESIPEPNAHQFRSIPFNKDWRIQIYRKLGPDEASRKATPPDLFYFIPMERPIVGATAFRQEFIRYLLWLKERAPQDFMINHA